jgi:hypothetical protein
MNVATVAPLRAAALMRANAMRVLVLLRPTNFDKCPREDKDCEEDGLLLSVGFLAAIILIGLGSAAVWGAIVGAVLISA